jgi:hypothetical protein
MHTMSFLAFLPAKISLPVLKPSYEQQCQRINSVGQAYQRQGQISQQVYDWFCWKPDDQRDYWEMVFSNGNAELYWDGVVDGQS